MTLLAFALVVTAITAVAYAARSRHDAAIWQAAYEAECQRHDKTAAELDAVLWTIDVAAMQDAEAESVREGAPAGWNGHCLN